jgi:hypothetical protein
VVDVETDNELFDLGAKPDAPSLMMANGLQHHVAVMTETIFVRSLDSATGLATSRSPPAASSESETTADPPQSGHGASDRRNSPSPRSTSRHAM